MPKEDAAKDVLSEYSEPLELSGTGSVDGSEAHIHVTLGREGSQALFGHLALGIRYDLVCRCSYFDELVDISTYVADRNVATTEVVR